MLGEEGEALSVMTSTVVVQSGSAGPIRRETDFSSSWLAVFITSRHEKRVAEHLQFQEIETFLPLYRTVHRWSNRCKAELQLPLFPNYVFVRISQLERGKVLRTPGVVSFVTCGHEPATLPKDEIDALRAGLHLRMVEPHPYLVVGHRVRIKMGPLAGLEGVLVRKKSAFRVVLTLDCLMRSVAVEVDVAEVEPLPVNSEQFSHLSIGRLKHGHPTP
ncbi:MAG: UpxY family transcription antiterminator [Terriglobales bacterium]